MKIKNEFFKYRFNKIKLNIHKEYEAFDTNYNKFMEFVEKIRELQVSINSENSSERDNRRNRVNDLKNKRQQIWDEMDREDNNAYYDNISAVRRVDSISRELDECDFEGKIEKNFTEVQYYFRSAKSKYDVLSKKCESINEWTCKELDQASLERDIQIDDAVDLYLRTQYGELANGEEPSYYMLRAARAEAIRNVESDNINLCCTRIAEFSKLSNEVCDTYTAAKNQAENMTTLYQVLDRNLKK